MIKLLSLAAVLFLNQAHAANKNLNKEIDCLARTIYHEARGEPHAGKTAVAMVTINRANSGHFPDSICKVVYEKGQYSWTKNKRIRIKEKDTYEDIRDFAHDTYIKYHVLKKAPEPKLKNAMFFSIAGFKNKNLKFIAKVGSHKFYSLKAKKA